MTRRKFWTMMGHSVGEGTAGSSPMIAAAPWLATRSSPEFALYPGIHAWTAKAGWSGSGGTPPLFTPGAGEFLTLTTNAPPSPAAPHPHPSPYNYPNTRSFPISPAYYQATDSGGGSWVGVELPLSWYLSNTLAQNLYFNKLCIPGSVFLRRDGGFVGTDALPSFGVPISPMGSAYSGGLNSYYAWWTPADKFDYAPATGRLWSVWETRMAACKAAIENGDAPGTGQGDTMDLDLVVLWFGDNDASDGGDRLRNYYHDIKAAVQRIRDQADLNNWSGKPGYQIPIVLMLVNELYGTPAARSTINDALQQLADEDPYIRVVSTDGETLSEAGYSSADAVRVGPATHLSHNAYIAIAELIYDAWLSMQTDALDALNVAELLTVQQIKDRVTTYYERSRTRNDASDTALLTHINGAMHHIENFLGDNCYWLRQRKEIELTETDRIITLPPYVQRLVQIEDPNVPKDAVKFTMIGLGDGGRILVNVPRGAGTYPLHYVTQSKDLKTDEQKVPIPPVCAEWLVVEACRRLARSSSNIPLMESFTAESALLAQDVSKHAATMQRGKNERMAAQQRLRGRTYTQTTNVTGRDQR